ncbi:hypothetical protein A7X67_16145 [Clostridium sp. W14A]|nr:hypothetical protein A7X67_16145 [Clostridium sp. W14A]
MSVFAVLLLGLGLATDACAVAMSCGIAGREFKYRHALKAAAFFGISQALMPLIGYYAARAVYIYISRAANNVAFALLALIGVHMIVSAIKKDRGKEGTGNANPFSNRSMLLLAVLTSLDALAVGVSFALVKEDILICAALIGGVTFFLSFFSVLLGKKLGKLFQRKAEVFGGIILIAVGFEILLGL